MAKAKTHYTCQACGYQTAKWLGKCPDCGAWSSLLEEAQDTPESERRPAWGASGGASKPVLLREVSAEVEARRRTGIAEFDRVLGGGVVAGSLVLLGGDPGIGKSTLLLAALDRLAKDGPVLYVSGEESLRQTKMRAERLRVESHGIHLFAETDADRVLAAAETLKPSALVVDSIQTMYLPELGSAPGSISQVREVAGRLMAYAKRSGVPTFLVGHVTKDGSIAGPRVLEHMVDTVLYFEGERGHPFRILRAHKNRFGSTNEIGVFEMKGAGLIEVADPSALFLSERPAGKSGSVVTSTLNGTRPLLVEVQALVAPTGYGTARRTAIGVDTNRVALLAAVLEKKEDIPLVGCDIFVNVAGGMTLNEPACDLAVCAALVSSLQNRPLDPHTLVLGEVGLAGEVRAVGQAEPRIAEAAKMGFKRVVLPKGSAKRLEEKRLHVVGVETLTEALSAMFD
ncbi:DNA repair protein RadA [Aggregicoccus sp. 17bor-14]|uniref:DNA repair protein RadA n=1 Tax=Myxococcaceae TaxID=31 RepID=UPI00129C8BD5|nr:MULTISPECIES: DNA repair protein RadA [Myxococcaceae]MBF5046568.1 DNA repair protein RadA [Simulacricoccus sp. 17bor-14]MRI92279.1 DNA repair protein RadA [Aggregicoccus sp. 17bor-14]